MGGQQRLRGPCSARGRVCQEAMVSQSAKTVPSSGKLPSGSVPMVSWLSPFVLGAPQGTHGCPRMPHQHKTRARQGCRPTLLPCSQWTLFRAGSPPGAQKLPCLRTGGEPHPQHSEPPAGWNIWRRTWHRRRPTGPCPASGISRADCPRQTTQPVQARRVRTVRCCRVTSLHASGSRHLISYRCQV